MNEYEWLKDCVKASGIGTGSEVESVLVDQMIPKLKEFLVLKLAHHLEEKDREVLQSMLMFTPESVEIIAFFGDLVPDLETKVKGYLAEFKQTVNQA